MVYDHISGEINRAPEDLVLVYNGQKIFSSSVTPRSLRLFGSAEMSESNAVPRDSTSCTDPLKLVTRSLFGIDWRSRNVENANDG